MGSKTVLEFAERGSSPELRALCRRLAGNAVVDELPIGNGKELTIRLAPDSSTSGDLVELLNNAHVTITTLSTKEGAAYLEVRIE